MEFNVWTVLAVLAAFCAPFLAGFLWWYLLSSERGERYLRQQVQGPYVPVHPDADENSHKSKDKNETP